MDHKQLTNPVSFSGKGGEFFGIWIVNILLSIVTLGIYSVWAKVRTKRYFYGNTYIDGDSFEYHAQPIQLLKGRLVAMTILLVWAISSSFFPGVAIALMVVFYLALPWLLWSNARFDAAMTSYRNVHFSFTAPLKGAYMTLMGRGILSILAMFVCIFAIGIAVSFSGIAAVILGVLFLFVMVFLYAWIAAGAHTFFINGYQYGDWQFSAELKLGFFVKTYLKAMAIGVAVTLIVSFITVFGFLGGIDVLQLISGDFSSLAGLVENARTNATTLIFIPYAAVIVLTITLTAYIAVCVRNYIFSQLETKNEEMQDIEYQFSSKLTVNGYIWLVVSNFLLQVVTLGLARPWVMVRTTNYLAEHTAVIGDMSQLVASDKDSNVSSAITDEVAQAFDLGIGIS